MSEAPPPKKNAATDCVACGKDLSKGSGRFLLASGPVCVVCYDAGRRAPPEKKKDKPA